MSDLKRKLSAIKSVFKKSEPEYKRFYNYDPKNPFPAPDQTYKKFKQPKPPQQGKGRKQKGGKRRKQKGGKRKRQKGGRRKRQRGGKRKRQRGGKRCKFIKSRKR